MAALRPVCASLITSLPPPTPPGAKGAQKPGPKDLGLCGPDAQADDFPAAPGLGRHRDHRRDRHDPPAWADFEVSGIAPNIGPVAGQRPVQKLSDPVIPHPLGSHQWRPMASILAQLRDRALRDPAETHRLHQLVYPARGDATDPGLLDDRDQGLFRGLAGLEKAGKVAALPQLRHPAGFSVPERVSRARSRYPLRPRSCVHRCAHADRRRSGPPRPSSLESIPRSIS